MRIAPAFFEDLDQQLRPERGPRGEPSVHDFESFDALPELITGRSEYQILIAAGSLVPRYAVVGQLASDGAVELIGIDLDLGAA